VPQRFFTKFPKKINRVKGIGEQGSKIELTAKSNLDISISEASISHRLVSSGRGRDLFSPANLQVTRMEMSNEIGSPIRDDQAFWRAHHEAWQHSALNHRQYCELHRFR
jgi:hypothetical protein